MIDNFDQLIDQALEEFANNPQENAFNSEPVKLTDYKDYAKFLQEISDEDENLAKSEISAMLEIEDNLLDEETDEFAEDMVSDDFAWYEKSNWIADGNGNFVRRDNGEIFDCYGNTVQVNEEKLNLTKEELEKKKKEKIAKSLAEKKKSKDLRKVEINRMAFDQKIIPLNDKISLEDKRVLVKLLTKPLRHLLEKYEAYIVMRVTKLLLPVIPSPVKLAALKWPWIFVSNPGFLYKTHPRNGEVKTFWINPKVPYYFKQGTEQSVLEERDASLSPFFLDRLDRVIQRWYEARDRLTNKEILYASRMINIKGDTYYHLLMLNPFWFEKLYKYYKDELL